MRTRQYTVTPQDVQAHAAHLGRTTAFAERARVPYHGS